MNLLWGWIKQRPHFIAEGLNTYFQVTVLHPYVVRGLADLSVNSTFLETRNFYNLPPHINNVFIRFINSISFILQFGLVIRKADIIWLTHPCYYSFIKLVIRKNQKVIYDVMDDFLEFPAIKENSRYVEFVKLQESILIGRANLVICSANSLKAKLQSRYNIIKDYKLIKNGIHIDTEQGSRPYVNSEFEALHSSFKIATYIGAISEWFDFNSVITALDVYSNLVICLFGPKDAQIPEHPRLKYFGIIKHEEVFDLMQKSDVLIMPFIVTELIKTVNPVKLYEYISSGKPSIAVRYKEIEELQDYVYLYNDITEFINYLTIPVSKKNLDECVDYTTKHTWEKRCDEIQQLLKNL